MFTMNKEKLAIILNFLIAQLAIFSLLFLTFVIENQKLIIVMYCLMVALSIMSYVCLYHVFKNIRYYAMEEAEERINNHQRKIKAEHIVALTENGVAMESIKREFQRQLSRLDNLHSQNDNDLYLQNDNEIKAFTDRVKDVGCYLYAIKYCENKVIDAILYNKLMMAKECRIDTKLDVVVPEEIGIDSIVLMTVYTNLLDNAIGVCQDFPQEKRYIEITSKVEDKHLMITVKNSKFEKDTVHLHRMRSSKKDTLNYDLGVYMIRNACKENHGEFVIENQKDFLICKVKLPLPNI